VRLPNTTMSRPSACFSSVTTARASDRPTIRVVSCHGVACSAVRVSETTTLSIAVFSREISRSTSGAFGSSASGGQYCTIPANVVRPSSIVSAACSRSAQQGSKAWSNGRTITLPPGPLTYPSTDTMVNTISFRIARLLPAHRTAGRHDRRSVRPGPNRTGILGRCRAPS
jgi:hypothetical protein